MGLADYLLRRSLDRVLLIFVVLIIQFLVVRVIPVYSLGIDPSQFFIRAEATPEEVQQIRSEFGLDEPIIPNQFVKYVLSLFTGQFGVSFVSKQPVYDEIWKRLPNTLMLQGSSYILVTIIGILVGLFAASRRGSKTDNVVIQLSIVSFVIPIYIMGIILLLALAWYPKITFGVTLFPISGTRTPLLSGDFLTTGADYLWHLSLPLISVVLATFGAFSYYVRNVLVSELGQDYILTDRAKGLVNRRIMRSHVLKSVAAPLVTNRALAIPFIIEGLIISEFIFGWYGMGSLLFDSLQRLDYPVVQAVFFVVAVILAITLLIVDVIVALVDPRVKLE